MKHITCISIIGLLSATVQLTADDREANTVILDETGVKNLRIQTAPVQKRVYETTVFVIGHLEEIPGNRSVLSSRVAGRVVQLKALVGDAVKKDQVLAVVESRQPGNPPPRIELKAPRSGIVVRSHVRLGQPVEPDRELMDISDRSSLWALAHIPEPEVPSIRPGTRARIRIPAIGGQAIEAKLERFVTEANHKTSTLDGIFIIPNPDARLRPGMRTEFSILTGRRQNVMAVPNESIQGPPSRPIVFVKDFDLPNAFIRAPVILGEKNDQFTEIISGLLAGDDVVTRGAYGLYFAKGGSGISLKEALDAAHGHEHNEDGSDMTSRQRTEQAAKKAGAQATRGVNSQILLACMIAAGFIFLGVAQYRWNKGGQS